MPVFFYLDPEFAADPAMVDVRDVTLSYTFFRSDDFDELEEEEEEEEARAAGAEAGGRKATGVRTHGTGAVPPGIKDTPRWLRESWSQHSIYRDVSVNRVNHFKKSRFSSRSAPHGSPTMGKRKKKEANLNMPRKKRADELAAAEKRRRPRRRPARGGEARTCRWRIWWRPSRTSCGASCARDLSRTRARSPCGCTTSAARAPRRGCTGAAYKNECPHERCTQPCYVKDLERNHTIASIAATLSAPRALRRGIRSIRGREPSAARGRREPREEERGRRVRDDERGDADGVPTSEGGAPTTTKDGVRARPRCPRWSALDSPRRSGRSTPWLLHATRAGEDQGGEGGKGGLCFPPPPRRAAPRPRLQPRPRPRPRADPPRRWDSARDLT